MRGLLKASSIFAVAIAAVLATAATAWAKPPMQPPRPQVTHVTDLPADYIDDTLCSFPVHVVGSDTFTEIDRYDANGNLLSVTFQDSFTGTATANGVTLNKYEHASITDDNTTGDETWKGLAEGYSYLNGGVIAQDIGVIVFDINGNTVEEHGPHPIADGPGAAAVCGVFAAG